MKKNTKSRKKPVKSNDNSETRLVTVGPKFPPTRNLAKTQIITRRFCQTSAVANQQFTLANGHDQFLTVTTTAGAAVPYVDSWRIKKMQIWAITSDDTSTLVNITPVGTGGDNLRNDRESIYEICSRSTADPAYMCIVPTKSQPFGSWHFTSNVGIASGLFIMSIGNQGSAKFTRVTMDITFEVVPNEAGLPLGYGVVTATTNLGTIGARNILSGMSIQGINNLG